MYVILEKALPAKRLPLLLVSKAFTKVAYQIGVDAHRSLTPLTYPAHAIALSCLYLASALDIDLEEPKPDPAMFDAAWAQQYAAELQDVQDISHAIIDIANHAPLYLPSRSSTTSPFETTSPAEPGLARVVSGSNWENTLFQLKIELRRREDAHRTATQTNGEAPRKRARLDHNHNATDIEQHLNQDLLGRDDMTVRFHFNQ